MILNWGELWAIAGPWDGEGSGWMWKLWLLSGEWLDGNQRLLGSFCCPDSDQRPGQWPVWGAGRGGRWRGGGEGTGSTLFPQSLHHRLLPLEQTLCFQHLLTHPSFSPFSPWEVISEPWWGLAAAASGGSDGDSGGLPFCVSLSVFRPLPESKEKLKEPFNHFPSFQDGGTLPCFH